jgi:hypothetical protein
MKTAFLFAVALLLSTAARAEESGPTGIVGKWTWTRTENTCTEVYDYRADGTVHVVSGDEVTDNTYAIDATPDGNGFFKMVLKVVKDHGGKDCADSEEDSTGQEQAVFVLFHTSKPLHVVCRDPDLDTCYGPLRRVQE